MQETKYLWKHDSRNFVLEGWGKPVRNLDGKNRFVVWRFDTHTASKARISVRLLNSFVLSASTDGEEFVELAREQAQGAKNAGWKSADLASFLPANHVYVKLEHGAPDKWNGGFGACIFEVRFETDDEQDLAVARAARTTGPIHIDGVLDEPDWLRAQPLETLTDRFLTRPVANPTTFRLCYDDKRWYVSAQCTQPGADEIVFTATDRDSATYSEDAVEFFFKPPGQADYYHVAINPSGTAFDERNAQGAGSWDSDVKAAVARSSDGWTLEATLPVSDMGADALVSGQPWRVALYRDNMGAAQYTAWSSVAGGGWHRQYRFGHVELVDATDIALAAVNVTTAGKPVMGTNSAVLTVTGAVNPDEHKLVLSLLPVTSTKLPEQDQDLAQMNPMSMTAPWPEPFSNSIDASYTLDRFGVAHLVADLRETKTGRTISRAVSSVVLTREDVMPLELTLRQPFITTEKELPLQIAVNLNESLMDAATIHLSIIDASDKEILALPVRPAEKQFTTSFDVQNLSLGSYSVHAQVCDPNGNTLAEIQRPLTKREPFGKPSQVRFDENGVCHVNGKPVMPLGFLLAPPDLAVAEAGYNVVLYGGETLESRNDLDVAAENGLLVMPHICNYLRGKSDYDAIRAVVSLRKTEPALFAWYLADEPEGYGDTPEVLRKAYTIIKEIDPDHPVVVLTNAPGMLAHYKGCADVIMADPYPIPGHPLSLVADWTDAAVAAAEANGQAVWMTPQGFGSADIGDSDAPSPTREELSAMLYTCLIHGAKGILWWPYSTPRQNYWPHFRKMGRECRFFEPWILHGTDVPDMPAGVQVAGDVHWRAWIHDGKVLILAANLARQSRHLSVALPVNLANPTFPFDEDIEAPGGQLSFPLAPVQTVAVVAMTGRP